MTDAWTQQNDIAEAIIVQGLGSKYLQYVRDAENAADMIKSLDNVLERSSGRGKLLLRKQWTEVKLATGGDMEAHLHSFDEATRKLIAAKFRVEDCGRKALPQLKSPVRFWRVLGRSG